MFVLNEQVEAPHASHTAEFMAFFRALETGAGAGRLFDDPYAAAFLSGPLRVAARLARVPLVGRAVPWVLDRWSPGARTSGAARTRLIDDLLIEALHAGCEQIVLLGAGFDARAHRLEGIERARVFEVDHAGTQTAKKERLHARLRRWPDHVVFVPVNFERDDLVISIRAAGFRSDAPSFFVWEGVTNYLTAAGVESTLAAIAALGRPGSRLLFTYVHRGLLEGSVAFPAARRLAASLQRMGEPWTFGLEPNGVGAFLAARGYGLLRDWSANDYREKYWGERGRRMRGYEFYRAALAELDPACRR